MKALLVVMLLSVLLPQAAQAQTAADCTSEAVADWMIQRQVGYNIVEPLVIYGTESFLDGLLAVQEVRRNLEDLPRPACADDLFILTAAYYNGIADSFAFSLAGDDISAARVTKTRTEQYESAVGSIYEELEAIAGIDTLMAAANIQIVPTATPDWPPTEEIALSGQHGGVLEAPIIVPPGNYRLRFEGDGGRGITAQADILSGDCLGFYTFVTAEVRSIEQYFRSEGCELAISIGQTDLGWRLSLTPIE